MKRFSLLIILLSFQQLVAQTFPAERDKFVKTWQQLVTDEAAQSYLKDELPQKIKGSLLNESQYKRLVDNCNKLAAKEVALYPEIFQYVQASVAIVEQKVPAELATPYFTYVLNYAADPDEKLSRLLAFSADFFRYNALYKERDYRWLAMGGTLSWEETKSLRIKATQVNLKCIRYNAEKQAEDSIVVYGTSGYYDIQSNKWQGSSGTLTWEKVKLPKTETYATLRGYKCDFATAKLKVDTVALSTPYFPTPILGKLTDLTTLDLGEQESAPQFVSYEKRLKIPNLREQMDYDGGFTLEGADFLGKGSPEKPAKLIFKRNGAPLFELSALSFDMTPSQIMARNVRAVLRYKNGDSLSIQDCFFTFNEKEQELRLAATKKGSDYYPFIDSYFQIYAFAPVLCWKKGSADPIFTYDVGTPTEQRVAQFESMNFFDPSLYQRFAAINGPHPFTLINSLVEKQNKTLFTEGELANALKKTIDQVKPQFVDMSAAGFLRQDPLTKKINVTPKLIAYAQATSGSGDYDNLALETDLRMLSMPETKEQIAADPFLQDQAKRMERTNKRRRTQQAYARIQLDKQELQLNEVAQITLSSAQQTYIYPDSSYVTMYRNRDIGFSGWLVSGKAELQTRYSKFDYEKFTVHILSTLETVLRVQPLRKEDGTEPILMFSSLKGLKGELLIDLPDNKSGKHADNGHYPRLQSIEQTRVYYNDPSILKGAYDSTRFYFAVAAFELDSLDNFSEATLRLDGQLVSAKIFPTFNESLRIMADYSFGFVKEAPTEGYAFYETTSRYKNKIYLSNNGLQGSGTLEFLHSKSISKKLTFLPDSTIGLAQFSSPELATGTRYPLAHSENALITYQPRKELLKITSYGETPVVLFSEEVLLDGQLLLDKKGMTAAGRLSYKEAQLNSLAYSFTNEDIRSDNASFALRNKFSSYGENPLAIQSDEMKAHISFKTRMGEFTSNGTKRIMFPANAYYCQMDKFTWFIDGESLDFKKNKGGETTFESGADLARNNFFSTHEKQDSLQFKSLSAKYDLKTQLILCDAVDYIQVGDARIFPDSMRVRIRKAAAMDTLKNAKVVANYITKFHSFTNATIKISGRNAYDGNATYPYYDRDSLRTEITMTSLAYKNAVSTAEGEILEKANFMLSPEFAYYGKVTIKASNPGLFLEGSTKLIHPCQYTKSWMSFKDTILAKNIQIPIAEDPRNAKGERLAVGFVWRQTERQDSLRIYPSFLSKMEGPDDPSLFKSFGYVQYNQALKEFQVGSKARLDGSDSLSNLLSLDVESCQMNGFGDISLGIKTADLTMELYGKISYNQETSKTRIAANARIQLPLDNSVLDAFIARTKLQEGAKEVDIKKPIYGLRNTFNHWGSAKEMEEFFKDFDEDKLRKMPAAYHQTFIVSGLVLESFGSNKPSSKKLDKGLISTNQLVGLISVNGTPILQEVEWGQFYTQCFSDQCNPGFMWELRMFDDTKYFFSYEVLKKDGEMSIYASDKAFTDAINAIKPEKRKTKNFNFTAIDEGSAANLLAKFRGYFLVK
ncbi:MAG: hypothetical protein RLZZ301_971 [Bacteroidota bacterium]|jgi:hypothetical protein